MAAYGKRQDPRTPEPFLENKIAQNLTSAALASGASFFIATATTTYQLPSRVTGVEQMVKEQVEQRVKEQVAGVKEQVAGVKEQVAGLERKVDMLISEVQADRRDIADFRGQLKRIPLPASPVLPS